MTLAAVALAAVLAAGTTALMANAMERESGVDENALVNYDGTFTAP
jgi:hypothetical protein